MDASFLGSEAFEHLISQEGADAAVSQNLRFFYTTLVSANGFSPQWVNEDLRAYMLDAAKRLEKPAYELHTRILLHTNFSPQWLSTSNSIAIGRLNGAGLDDEKRGFYFTVIASNDFSISQITSGAVDILAENKLHERLGRSDSSIRVPAEAELNALMESLTLPERENIRQIYQGIYAFHGLEKLGGTPAEAKLEVLDVARTMAFTAFKTQSALQKISRQSKTPVVAAYILSTGFGLRPPTTFLGQLKSQYSSNPRLLNRAFSEVFANTAIGGAGEDINEAAKITLLAKAFNGQVASRMKGKNASGLEMRAGHMAARLETGREWMTRGHLDWLIVPTAYKISSGGDKLSETSGRITQKIAEVALPLGCPIVFVDHSTVRTLDHPTLAQSGAKSGNMGRAIAQAIESIQKTEPAAQVGWLTVLNNWSIVDLYSAGKPSVIGFNLYAGIEYQSSKGARKNLWLPIDDRPFFVGYSWDDQNVRRRANITFSIMDKDFKIRTVGSAASYWAAFRERYVEMEADQRMEWATPHLGKIVLFDMDGTIVDINGRGFEASLQKSFGVMQSELQKAGVSVELGEIDAKYRQARIESRRSLYEYGRYRDMETRFYNTLRTLAKSNENFFIGQKKNGEIQAQLRSISKAVYDAYWADRLAAVQPYEKAISAIGRLNDAGYKVIVLSDRRDSELHDIMQLPAGGGRSIKDIVLGAIITNDMVSETGIDVPICRLGLPKEDAAYARVEQLVHPLLMVGDMVKYDTAPAEKIGIPGVLVKGGTGFDAIFERLPAKPA